MTYVQWLGVACLVVALAPTILVPVLLRRPADPPTHTEGPQP